ncbi:hypothetical protein BDN72DRAFT_775555, partial [Pluteus cervinus]
DHLNATYITEDNTPLYRVEMPHHFTGGTATVKKLIPDFDEGHTGQHDRNDRYAHLGQVEFHMIESSVIHYGGEEWKTSQHFTKEGKVWRWSVLGRDRKFTGPDGKEYVWILGLANCKLVLNDEEQSVVARLHVERQGILHRPSSAKFEITELGTAIQDVIFMTFVYIEKIRVDMEKTAKRGGTGGDI